METIGSGEWGGAGRGLTEAPSSVSTCAGRPSRRCLGSAGEYCRGAAGLQPRQATFGRCLGVGGRSGHTEGQTRASASPPLRRPRGNLWPRRTHALVTSLLLRGGALGEGARAGAAARRGQGPALRGVVAAAQDAVVDVRSAERAAAAAAGGGPAAGGGGRLEAGVVGEPPEEDGLGEDVRVGCGLLAVAAVGGLRDGVDVGVDTCHVRRGDGVADGFLHDPARARGSARKQSGLEMTGLTPR